MCIIRLSVDFRMGEKTIKIPQSLFSFSRSAVCACVCARHNENNILAWRMEKEVQRRFMGVSIFTVSNSLLLPTTHGCLFAENGCFYYWSREIPNLYLCTFVCLSVCHSLLCYVCVLPTERENQTFNSIDNIKYNHLIDDDTM